MDVYATADDLDSGNWLPADVTPDSGDIDRNLKYATIVVAKACNLSLYSGDPSFLAPLVDATCAQAASWLTLGLDPAKLGLDQKIVKKSSILGADVERDTSGQLAAFQEAVSCLCPAAMNILVAANLIWLPVPLSGDDSLPHWGFGFEPPVTFADAVEAEIAAESAWPFW